MPSNMRTSTDLIIVTATPYKSLAALEKGHLREGRAGAGVHLFIDRHGRKFHTSRHRLAIGNHTEHFNEVSYAVALAAENAEELGGRQLGGLFSALKTLISEWPQAIIRGQNQMIPGYYEEPYFDVVGWVQSEPRRMKALGENV